MNNKLSVKQAIRCGLLVVNGPVLLLMLVPLAVFALLVDRHIISRDYNWVGLLVFVAGFAVAWLWWSLSVARWRVWAYEKVTDLQALKEEAVAVGLTWPDGHIFEATEIKPQALAERQRRLERPSK